MVRLFLTKNGMTDAATLRRRDALLREDVEDRTGQLALHAEVVFFLVLREDVDRHLAAGDLCHALVGRAADGLALRPQEKLTP